MVSNRNRASCRVSILRRSGKFREAPERCVFVHATAHGADGTVV
jgi:hypothetical protein